MKRLLLALLLALPVAALAQAPILRNSLDTNTLGTNLTWNPSTLQLRASGATPSIALWNTSGSSDGKRFDLTDAFDQLRFGWLSDNGGSALVLGHVDTNGNWSFNGYVRLSNQTNQIGDNGTSLTYNGVAIGGTSETNVQNNFYSTNMFFISGKGNTLIITNYVRFPWTTLALTGTNVAQIDLSAGSMFRVYLTNNAFFNAVASHPGTNMSQTIQIALIQDGTGTRNVTMTNSTWFLSGSGATTNAMPVINTNGNAVSLLTFVTSPTNAVQLLGVPTTISP